MAARHHNLSVVGLVAIAAAFAACAEAQAPVPDGIVTTSTTADASDGDSQVDVPPGCLPTSCQIGTNVCGGAGAVISCVDDGTGCGIPGDPIACALDEVCEAGECVLFAACADGDGDGYGDGCTAGPDCDDVRSDVNPSQMEVCGDQLDNDCANGVDDGCAELCAGAPCSPPQRQCDGNGGLQECVLDADGCGEWGPAVACASGTCTNGACAGCTDGDGDGRGANCPLGSDCNDGDAAIYDGAPERCDGKDNDCDNATDEDFPTVGDTCTAGQGACQGTGTFECAPTELDVVCTAMADSPEPEMCGDAVDSDYDGNPNNGFGNIGDTCTIGSGSCTSQGTTQCDASNRRQTTCDAPPPSGTPEVCDGADNDCDGTPDDGGVCTSCTEDGNEPNNSSLETTNLTSGSKSGIICGENVDWFFLGTGPSTVTITLDHPTGSNPVGATWSDLNVEFFCGAAYCSGIYGIGSSTSATYNSIGCCSTASDRFTLRIFPASTSPASGTPYTISH